MHVQRGAAMVEFAGWEMPLHYGSQIEEHHAVRKGAGMFDVSHMGIIDVGGSAARYFLRIVMANDVGKLFPGKGLYGCMLNDTGGVIDDLIAYSLAEGRYRLVVNAATAARDLTWMKSAAANRGLAVELEPLTSAAMIAVQGPSARESLGKALPDMQNAIAGLKVFGWTDAGGVFVARTGYTGEDGCEVVVPANRAESLWSALGDLGVAACGLGARDTLRLEAGLNLYGQDMDESVTPLESGLAWTVDFREDRDFIGANALRHQLAQGGLRQFVGLKLVGRGVMRPHQRVHTSRGDGDITSGTFSPTLGCSIALARIPAGVPSGEQVTVDLRGKPAPAQIVKYPFVRNGKPLI
jgi:aminomethyltransferase